MKTTSGLEYIEVGARHGADPGGHGRGGDGRFIKGEGGFLFVEILL